MFWTLSELCHKKEKCSYKGPVYMYTSIFEKADFSLCFQNKKYFCGS